MSGMPTILARLRSMCGTAPRVVGWAACLSILLSLLSGVEAGADPDDEVGLWSSIEIDAPVVIEATLETDLLVYDLCWANHQHDARAMLVEQIVEQMNDPEALYVVSLPQLPAKWEPLPRAKVRFRGEDLTRRDRRKLINGRDLTGLNDINGHHILRSRIRLGKRVYESDVEEALIDIMAQIESLRPGSLVSINGFHCNPRRNGRDCRYEQLSEYMDFVFCGADHKDARESDEIRKILRHLLNRRVERELARREMWTVFCHDHVWYLATTGEVPRELGVTDEVLIEEWIANGAEVGEDDVVQDRDEPGDAPPQEPQNDPQGGPDPGDPDAPTPPEDGGDAPEEGDPQPDPGDAPGDQPGEEDSPDPDEESPGEEEEEADPDEVIIVLPERSEEPHGSQWGPQTRASLEVYPAQYTARTSPIVRWPISTRGARSHSNPRGWTNADLETQGWDAIESEMQEIYDLGFREVWFFNWSGQHEVIDEFTMEMMPWFSTDSHTQAMLDTWEPFVQRWKARGMTFGYYLGGCVTPNHGTMENPDLRPITRADFDFFVQTLRDIHALGFDSIGMDAFRWILNRRDQPEGRNWAPWPNYPPRDTGIFRALCERILSDPQLQDVYLAAERWLPYGEYMAMMPSLFNVTSRARNDSRPDVDELGPKTIEDTVNPGNEIVAMLMGVGWTRAEYNEMRQKLSTYGYRMCVSTTTLREVGLLD